jgi:hypothetical protein
MARQLLSLDANLFNDATAHMIAIDYMQSPADRLAIESLVDELEAQGRSEHILETGKEAKESLLMSAVSDAVIVWGVISLWGYGKAWLAADDLQGLERFTYAMKAGEEGLPAALRSKLVRAGLSLAVGSSISAYQYLYRTRFDPKETLGRIQDQVVQDLAEKAANYRKTLQYGSKDEKVLEASRQDLANMEDQVLQLSKADPQFHGRLTPVAEDISAAQYKIENLLKSVEPESKHVSGN